MTAMTRRFIPALASDALTPLYDAIVALTMRERAFRQRLVAQADLAPGQRVLDVGCGTGTFALMLATAEPRASVVGLDVDPRILAVARHKASRAGVTVEWVLGAAANLPFPPASFDRVTSSLMLHHLTTPEKRTALASIRHVLRPGGALHVADFGRPRSAYTRLAASLFRHFDGPERTAANLEAAARADARGRVRGGARDRALDDGVRDIELRAGCRPVTTTVVRRSPFPGSPAATRRGHLRRGPLPPGSSAACSGTRRPPRRRRPGAARPLDARPVGWQVGPVQDQLIFLIGAPRSGTTLLARMLSAHSQIQGRAEPHLITPIAYLGYFGKVQKAPYDQNNVEQAIREVVTEIPRHEAGYLDALRAYTDSLYAQLMEVAPPGKRLFLDKTPAYALVLPFLTKLYPHAKYVVLTRHPLAVLSSYVESFFDGAYRVALEHNPVLQRYVPELARFVRERPVPHAWLKYEELVKEPETHFRRVCEHLGVPFEERAISYGESGEAFKGLGDPTGVARHTRPVTGSVSKWAAEIASNPDTLALVSQVLDRLDDADLDTLGYPRARIVEQLEAAKGAPVPVKAQAPLRYRMERKALVALRRNIKDNALGRVLQRARFALDVLLRE